MLKDPYPTKCGVVDYKIVKDTWPYAKGTCHLDCILASMYEKCGCLGYDVEDLVGKNSWILAIKSFSLLQSNLG